MASSARKKASPLLSEVMKLLAALSRDRQDAIATQILDTLNREADPANARFHQLIEQKYTTGLSKVEVEELDRLETDFQAQDEQYYAPILARISAKSK